MLFDLVVTTHDAPEALVDVLLEQSDYEQFEGHPMVMEVQRRGLLGIADLAFEVERLLHVSMVRRGTRHEFVERCAV